jgi:hypothetical protein
VLESGDKGIDSKGASRNTEVFWDNDNVLYSTQ